MDNPIPKVVLQICKKHNQPIRYDDQASRNSLCDVCILDKANVIPVEQILKQYQQIIINDNKETDLQLQQLNNLKDGILRYKESIISVLNKSIQQITDQINSIQSQKQSIQQLDYIMNKYASTDDLTFYLNTNKKINKEIRYSIIINLLQDIKLKIKNIDFLHSIQNRKQQSIIQTQVPKKINIQEIIPIIKQKNLQKMEYGLIHQVQQRMIYDLVIDQSNNTLIAAMQTGIIKIYEFKNSMVGNQIKNLQEHTQYVGCLHRMKNAHSFVSGGFDRSIIFWCLDKKISNGRFNRLGESLELCNLHNHEFKRRFAISGNRDETVKFWKKQNDSWNLLQIINVKDTVYALSLNENEDKLIACTNSSQIQVMNIKSNQEWEIVQTIEVKEYGYRLCFLLFKINLSFSQKRQIIQRFMIMIGLNNNFTKRLKFKYKVLKIVILYFLVNTQRSQISQQQNMVNLLIYLKQIRMESTN